MREPKQYCRLCNTYTFILIIAFLRLSWAQTPRKMLESSDWIQSRLPSDKLNLISWLVDGCFFYSNSSEAVPMCDSGLINADMEAPPEFQSFDGFYNNIFKVDLGAVDTALLRRVPPVYRDGVYLPVEGKRINPFIASSLMERKPNCTRDNGETVACGSKTGKSAFLVFFGQQVVEEILDAQRPGCPPEYFNIPIPPDHTFKTDNPKKSEMPLLRSRYDQRTGHSPGNPRQQINEITPWIDGGLIYGTAKGWADVLRTFPNGTLHPHGQLASDDDKGLFPVKNKLRMPLANPPPPFFHGNWTNLHHTANVDRFFVLGNPRGNENAYLLGFGVVLFRWHNQFATYLHDSRPHWSGERVFQEARKWAIATYQQIVMYDWLPEWLGEPLEAYKGYDPSVDPQIEQFFQTAAMRFGHTLVTPGAYLRDYACAGCRPVPFYGFGDHRSETNSPPLNNMEAFNSLQTVRTCNIFWRPQEPLVMNYTGHECLKDDRTISDIDRLLMGLASQRAEREDHMIVEDLRGQVFGPLEFSRRDLMAVNIQRGRDHGTPDYNTAREAFGLERIRNKEHYMENTGTDTPEDILENLENYHGTNSNESMEEVWSNIDVWTGGILETSDRPGPLFRAIIKDQFTRIRNADRFWFENIQWKTPRFSKLQVERIRTLKVFDMVISVTRMLPEDMQPNPFQVPGDEFFIVPESDVIGCKLTPLWEKSNCSRQTYDSNGSPVGTRNYFNCYHFPQLDSKVSPVENCSTPGSYDYFKGSETSFILTFLLLGFLICGLVVFLFVFKHYIHKTKNKNLAALKENLLARIFQGEHERPIAAREWQNFKDEFRVVALIFNGSKLEVRSHRGDLLRDIDFEKKQRVDLIQFPDQVHLILENPTEYDLVLKFEGDYFRNAFTQLLHERLRNMVQVNIREGDLKHCLKNATTQRNRIAHLEKFFRAVFKIDSQVQMGENIKELWDSKIVKEVETMELTKAEFGSALGMCPTSEFVQKMFRVIDVDQNGYISFREFFNMLSLFHKGTAEDKAQLLFQMYDTRRANQLSLEEFKGMIRSMIAAANADINKDSLEESINSMLKTMRISSGTVTLQDFLELFAMHKDALGYASLRFGGVNVPEARVHDKQAEKREKRKSFNERAFRSINRMDDDESISEDPMTDEVMTVKTGRKKNKFSSWFELNRLRIFWVTLYTLVVIAIFGERAYYYSFEREHGGLRQIAGYGVTITRGSASVMMFCYATLLLTMCKNTITKLRETFLHRWIPFDGFLSMHKYIACLALGFTVIHTVGHAINFYHISTQTAEDLSCLFRDYHRQTHILPKFHYWTFQTITGLTGILLVIHSAIIHIFATSYARLHTFRMFWITHSTYPIWYILILLHGSGRLVQEPLFLNFLLGPLFFFVLDKLVTVGRNDAEIPVIEAQLLPSNVTKLKFSRPTGFEFKSGQWIRIACLDLNPNEFHPFTISSAPHEPHLTVHIRAVGPFTANIRQVYEISTPKLYLDGPYGEGHQDWYRYEVSVLIGGGIGVTPFASILKDVAASTNKNTCKKIYFLWVTRTQKQFEWLVDIVREVEHHKLIDVHVFITQIHHQFDLRTVLLYICERNFQKVSNRSLFTGLKSVTHFGRPNFDQIFKHLADIHPEVLKFGVFSCGPLPMSKNVDDACHEINIDNNIQASFHHHFENF